MKKLLFHAAAMALSLTLVAPSAHAVITQDTNVTNAFINGSGVTNGGFTVDRNISSGVELGLRAKVRFPVPVNAYPNDGAGTFGPFAAGHGGPGANPATPTWSFEWSINSNFNGNGVNVGDLTYQIRMDSDPGAGTSFLQFDPIHSLNPNNGLVFWDHSFGNNGTANGAGVEATDAATYAALMAGNNLAQNSWRMDFFFAFPAFNPNVAGVYTFQLEAFNAGGVSLALTSIDVLVASPEPTAMLTWAGLGCAAAVVRWRRKKTA